MITNRQPARRRAFLLSIQKIFIFQNHSFLAIPFYHAYTKKSIFFKIMFFWNRSKQIILPLVFQIESDIRLNRAELPHVAINGEINIISLPHQKTPYKPKYGEIENMTESEPAAGIPDGIRQLFQKILILKNQ